MSQKPRLLEIHSQICDLDNRYRDAQDTSPMFPTNFRRLAQRNRNRLLRAIYETGVVPRKSVETLVPAMPVACDDERLGALLGMPETQLSHEDVQIPEELLYPKPKRGRPRSSEWSQHASSLNCSQRHARRLLSEGRTRTRDRSRYPDDVVEALAARKKRAALKRELEKIDILSDLERMIDYLGRGREAVLSAPIVSADARRLATRLVGAHGSEAALLLCGFAFGGSLKLASIGLTMSRATIYRRFGSQLEFLRECGMALAAGLQQYGLAHIAKTRRISRRRRIVDNQEGLLERLADTYAYGTQNGSPLIAEIGIFSP